LAAGVRALAVAPGGAVVTAGALLALGGSSACAVLAGLLVRALSSRRGGEVLGAYGRWWKAQCAFLRLGEGPRRAAWVAPLALCGAAILIAAGRLPFGALALAVALGIPLVLRRRAAQRRVALAAQLDGTLTALANALSVAPNLGDALKNVAAFADPPMRDEIRDALAAIDLGSPIDDALLALSARLGVPGFEVAMAAAITGRRTGGNLADILKRTAASLREMSRLEGVIRTKTAEGRNQALVMGLVPPALIAALQKIDPTWLLPMWHDPIGWILLGAAAVLEIAAVALIRKIMAVDI
jgi:tight adherence protein B